MSRLILNIRNYIKGYANFVSDKVYRIYLRSVISPCNFKGNQKTKCCYWYWQVYCKTSCITYKNITLYNIALDELIVAFHIGLGVLSPFPRDIDLHIHIQLFRISISNCHSPNDNTTQPQHCSWVGQQQQQTTTTISTTRDN